MTKDSLVHSDFVFRILLDVKTHKILMRDMALFEISKMNTLINRIIANYYEVYHRSTFSFFRVIQMIKDKTGVDDKAAKSIVEDIYKAFRFDESSHEKSNVSISIRSNSESETAFNLMIQSLNQINNPSVGFIIKNMLLEYTRLSRLEREKIIFKRQLDIFQQAMKNNSKLVIESHQVTRVVHPGTVIEPLDDYGNYLLVYNEKLNKMNALLLRRVKKMYPNGEHFVCSEKMKNLIETYRNKDLSILSKDATEALQVLLSKDNLADLNKIFTFLEDKGNFKFDRLTEASILSILPELKRQRIGLTQDELDELPNKQ